MRHSKIQAIHMDCARQKMERTKRQERTHDFRSIWAESRNTLWTKRDNKPGRFGRWQAANTLWNEEKGMALASLEDAAKNGLAKLAVGANLDECAEVMASRKGITPQDTLAIESIRKKVDFGLYRMAWKNGTVFKPASLQEIVSAITAKARGARPKAGRGGAIVAVWEAECPLLPKEKARLEKELANGNGKAGLGKGLAGLGRQRF